ncbi:tetraacyldisaccharide 4'-kinase [Gimesia algae]|uniref:Tetraacyldisaccharide 4'-kinase n=1 Tax=Gimesia algae TaxID=2527971 RepID=A0A517VEA8_9PLAN|nr:tetraacyldisaccharide 4'-kinase [Gimesia algae]QDT91335.1 Tetraacyldisaccharide 4'-kinase [Gimesia algae]
MDEVEYLRIISGQRQDWRARLLYKPCFRFLSLLYRVGVSVRNRMFDWRLRSVRTVEVPVISLGNLTTGGTGKTPFVAYLTQWFQNHQKQVALLSRGYRALPGEVNDEKLLLDRLCPGVPHFQNPDRGDSAVKAIQEGAQILILDDGFQHRKLERTVDLVLIDAVCPWGYGSLLPRGLMREPKSSLRRADFVILTRVDQCSAPELEQLSQELTRLVPADRIATATFQPRVLINVKNEALSLKSVNGKRVWAFCAIGNPAGFRLTLEQAGFDVAGLQVFADHHHYSSDDVQEIGAQAREAEVDLILTTGKDLVKMSEPMFCGVPVWGVEIGVEIREGSEFLEQVLQGLIK